MKFIELKSKLFIALSLIATSYIFEAMAKGSTNNVIPQSCRHQIAANETDKRPEGNVPVVKVRKIRCWNKDQGRNAEYDMYWLPGKSLWRKERIVLDSIFVLNIGAITARGNLIHVLTHILEYLPSSDKYKRLYNRVSNFGMIAWANYNEKKAKAEIKNGVIDALLKYQSRKDFKNRKDNHLDAIIFYGLTKAKEFGVLKKGINIEMATATLVSAVKKESKKGYNEKYKNLERELSFVIDSFI